MGLLGWGWNEVEGFGWADVIGVVVVVSMEFVL
jgi:hypothetical protein